MNNANDHKHLIGLTMEDAEEAAKDMGYSLVRIVGHGSVLSAEHRPNRITLWIKDDTVVNVMLG